MRDPMMRQEISRSLTASHNQLRSKVQVTARNLMQSTHKALSSPKLSAVEAGQILGKLEGYVAVREAMLPEIALDGYTNDIKGLINKIKRDVLPVISGEIAFVVSTKRATGDQSMKLSKVVSPLHLLPEDAVSDCERLNNEFEGEGQPYVVNEIEVTTVAQFETMQEYENL